MTDFEVSLLGAIETELPLSQQSACFFHLCQSFLRKTNELGLKRAYETELVVRKKLRQYAALAYLPVALMRPNLRLETSKL